MDIEIKISDRGKAFVIGGFIFGLIVMFGIQAIGGPDAPEVTVDDVEENEIQIYYEGEYTIYTGQVQETNSNVSELVLEPDQALILRVNGEVYHYHYNGNDIQQLERVR